MSVENWDYENREAGINRASGVIASIADSWSRCREFGLRAAGTPSEIVLSEDKFKTVFEQNESIRHFVIPEMELLYNQIAGTNFMVAYADPGGVVLDSIQDEDFKAGEGGKAVIPGSVWVENHRGTNALGLAIHTKRPAIVTGKDHFFHKLNDLSCFAVPIFDHEEKLLGVIDATSNAKARNEHTLALVKLASRNIENRLFSENFCDSLILMFHARQEYLPTTSVAMIAVDEYGFIEGANANAKAVLNGLDISRTQHFGEIFDVQFFDIVDQLRSNGIISIKDRMGSVVFMRAQPPISRRVIKVDGDLLINNGRAEPLADDQKAIPNNDLSLNQPTEAKLVFEDEVLSKDIKEAVRGIQLGLPLTILGDPSTGKTELAREINEQAFGKSKLTEVDCLHINPEQFEKQMFGDRGKIGFFDQEPRTAKEGKLFLARGGVVLFKNIHALDSNAQDIIAAAQQFEETQRDNNQVRSIKGWIFSGPIDWLDNNEFQISSRFANSIQGKKLNTPSLSQRSDFEKVACAIASACSSEYTLSPVALRILKSCNWTGNFSELKKVIRLAISQSPGKVIRHEISEALSAFTDDGLQPCPHCVGSPVRAETCIMIQRSWEETGGNVSLVARRLGVSRNTVYKHVKSFQ